MHRDTLFEGRHCAIAVGRPAPGVLIVRFEGRDTGELGRAPFLEMERDLARFAKVELFIDAQRGKSASIDVSGEWAFWLRRHRERLVLVHMLTATRFVQLSADLVRKYADLEGRMRIYADPKAFEAALADAKLRAREMSHAG